MNKLFLDKFKILLKENFYDFLEGIKAKSKGRKFFRINIARNFDYLKELNYLNVNYEKDSFLSNFYSVGLDDVRLSDTISFKTGGFYIQNPSSYLPVKFLTDNLDSEEPLILDMAASPGGKTTALSETLNRKGFIVANEPSKKRLKNLIFNIEKSGAWNIAVVSYDGRVLSKVCEGVFDAVLLDAPCSNENKIFHDKKVAKNWNEELVKKLSKLQKELIDTAFKVLKPGGILIYSTCTFSVEENEEVVDYLLNSYDSELLDLNNGKFNKGLSGNNFIDDRVVRILPGLNGYDSYEGFFVAGFKKKSGLQKDDKIYKRVSKNNYSKILKRDDFFVYEKNNDLYLSSQFIINGLKYEKFGMKLGKKIEKDKLEFSTQALWEFGCLKGDELEVSYDEAVKFLQGYDIQKSVSSDFGLVTFSKIPVGGFKRVGNLVKNKVDRYFIRGVL